MVDAKFRFHDVVPAAVMKFSDAALNAEPFQYRPVLLRCMLTSTFRLVEPEAKLPVPVILDDAPAVQPAVL